MDNIKEKIVSRKKKLQEHMISGIIQLRLDALQDLQKELKVIEGMAKERIKTLTEAAPDNIREWVEISNILHTLMKNGDVKAKIICNEFGFKNIADIKAKLEALKVAWKKNINIHYVKQARDYKRGITVIITAVDPFD